MARAGAVGKSIGCLAASANPEKGIQAIFTATQNNTVVRISKSATVTVFQNVLWNKV